jgi:arylsulfatase A-like enzyme
MKIFSVFGGAAWTALLAGQCVFADGIPAREPESAPNILLVSVDDFKPMTGAYGHETIQTPHMDRLARKGIIFERAYCQQAICAPSRASLLTGMRPDTTGVIDLFTHFRDVRPEAVTLPQFFAEKGYRTWGTGKIFHASRPHDPDDQSYSWNEGYEPPEKEDWIDPETLRAIAVKREKAREEGLSGLDFYSATRGPTTEMAEVPDEAYPDGAMTRRLIEKLEEKAASGEPYFYTIGYRRPHLPFTAPKRYWDLYDRDTINLPSTDGLPDGAPPFSFQDSWELRSYPDIPPLGESVSKEKARELIHGYYASVSYVDALVGELLGALERLGLAENTIILIFGDHGYHLGDHGMWCKHTNFEQATRSALLLRYPGNPEGRRVGPPVELLDIYPTLVDLAGFETPGNLEGSSLVPIVENADADWKPMAMSQYPRHIGDNPRGMGYSLRTERYRYTEWVVNPAWPDGRQFHPWPGNEVVQRELYDYEKDPHETRNLIQDETYAEVRKELAELMRSRPVQRQETGPAVER